MGLAIRYDGRSEISVAMSLLATRAVDARPHNRQHRVGALDKPQGEVPVRATSAESAVGDSHSLSPRAAGSSEMGNYITPKH